MSGDAARIEEKIRETIAAYDMLPEGGTVIVGLSGGADSMALTHFLFHRLHAHILAAHVNHCLRGAESDADERFVQSWCAQNAIPLEVRRVDVTSLAAAQGVGLEEAGRVARYAFFEELAAEPNHLIATAHTLSDQAETVLFRAARGAGAKGLCGIPPVRGRIVRPLLHVTREEVETYCAHYALPFVTDSTNRERDYARNRIRLDAIPVFRSINPAFEESIWNLTQTLSCDTAYLEGEAEQAVLAAQEDGGWRRDTLAELPPPVLVRALARILPARQDRRHLETAVRVVRGGGSATLGGGIQITASGNTVFIGTSALRADPPPRDGWRVPVQFPETPLPDGRTVIIRLISKKDIENTSKFHNLLFHNRVNYDTISNDMFFRLRREGDVFRPAGRGVSKPLKKLFNETKLPVPFRSQAVLLDSGTELLWLEGFGAAEVSRVTADTKNIAEICIRGVQDVE